MSKYFILSCYYHICLPQPIWNSFAHRKRAPGRRGIVCDKSDQIELQLDRSQLPYSKYLGPVPQDATQPTLTTKSPLQRVHVAGFLFLMMIFFRDNYTLPTCGLALILSAYLWLKIWHFAHLWFKIWHFAHLWLSPFMCRVPTSSSPLL